MPDNEAKTKSESDGTVPAGDLNPRFGNPMFFIVGSLACFGIGCYGMRFHAPVIMIGIATGSAWVLSFMLATIGVVTCSVRWRKLSLAGKIKAYLLMAILLLLTYVLAVFGLTGCWIIETAPAGKRVASDVLMDRQFMTDTVLPAVKDEAVQRAFRESLGKLDRQIAEFQDFMRQVETGKIKVTKGYMGLWQSVFKQNSCSFRAHYRDKTAPVTDFTKRETRSSNKLIWTFWFHANGHLKVVMTPDCGFNFDETGKMTVYWFSSVRGKHELYIQPDGAVMSRFYAHQS